jgi:hypothetical protein
VPDDKQLIRARLGKLGLAQPREEEIVREIGDHLADHAACLEADGMTPEVAARTAFESIADWTKLREGIVAAEMEEMTMNYRTNAY